VGAAGRFGDTEGAGCGAGGPGIGDGSNSGGATCRKIRGSILIFALGGSGRGAILGTSSTDGGR
jgi:hypothetical protein